MAIIGGSVARVMPSHVMPQILMQYNQSSGAFETLATSNPIVQLGEGDQYVYVNHIDLRTEVATGQSAGNQLPSCSVVLGQAQTPTYLIRNRAEYDRHDIAMAGRWGISAPEAHRRAMRQGHFQQCRNALIYGFNPANGEGLLSANGATAVSLPADPNGATTVVTYDNGAMALLLLQQIVAVKQRMFQLGQPSRITVLGPQRVLGLWTYANVVQLVQFQRPGAGTDTTGGMVRQVVEQNDDEIDFVYDDTLIGKGAGGTDAVIINIPEVKIPATRNKINTNEFAGLQPGLDACMIQLADMAAPMEITVPLAGGATDVTGEMRITSGWALRPESVTIMSMQYQ